MEYRKASFRGAEFEVTSRSWSSGRRNQVHEYPNKDIPYTEDLGKKAESYPVTAFVIGSDYKSKRDALRKACIQEGSGTLIHPDYGTIEVICDSISIKEDYSSQRMAIIELVFIEVGEKAIPETSIDYAGQITSSAGSLTSAAKNSFVSGFSLSDGVEGLTGLLGSISDLCTSSLDNIGTGIGYAEGLASDVQGAMNNIVAASSYALSLKTSAKALLNTPNGLASQIDTVFSAISSLAGGYSGSGASSTKAYSASSTSSSSSSATSASSATVTTNAFKTVRELASKSNASETANTSNDDAKAEKKCMQQIEQLTKQIVVAKEAEVITTIEFASAEDAEVVLDDFLTDVEEVELFEDVEPSSEVMQSLRDLREIVIEYMQNIAMELPRTRSLILNGSLPSLVVAYDLYEDVNRADEIVKKNKIAFPGFIPAGKELKVLTE